MLRLVGYRARCLVMYVSLCSCVALSNSKGESLFDRELIELAADTFRVVRSVCVCVCARAHVCTCKVFTRLKVPPPKRCDCYCRSTRTVPYDTTLQEVAVEMSANM